MFNGRLDFQGLNVGMSLSDEVKIMGTGFKIPSCLDFYKGGQGSRDPSGQSIGIINVAKEGESMKSPFQGNIGW